MLGLSEGISTCLCDLDGVLTQRAKAHAATLAAHGATLVVGDLGALFGAP